jgi:flagellar FliL protein
MNTVIIICNDPHIVLVKEAIQPLLTAKISIVPDFDTGLKEVFEKRPLVVFIQDEIAGVKGETVTRHIKSLLQANSPQFIHLAHATGPDMMREFHDGINLNLPIEELRAVFREHLPKVPGIRWKEQAASPAEPVPLILPPQIAPAMDEVFSGNQPGEQASAHEDEIFSFVTHFENDAPSFPVDKLFSFIGDDVPHPEGDIPAPPAPDPPSPEPVDFRKEHSAPPSVRVPEPPLKPLQPAPAPDSDWMTGADSEELPFPVEPAAPARKWRMPLAIVGVVLVALVCGVVLYLMYPGGPKPQSSTVPPKPPIAAPVPAAPATATPVGTVRRVALPSFIPKEELDPAYGTAKPGWERYVSPRREYLVFRENGAIRAIQIMALQKNGIDASFVTAALRELCGDATCVIRSRSSRDGYLIEQGETSNKAEVIFYKSTGTGETRGVVLSLP